ncbi:ribonuclease III [Rathayibacter toxicus]|uniref:ribonuclease III n=1 Tax=Rathayibacter toxicus TaxID=145458 RepID=UPI0009E3E64B|nr:ribonuclease III [Rathayibacter toxicus]PPG21631.1 ribonuclease III [Rathayibacter toxicus]PPG46593.1 ribonuclease III [Rathayibacter toxicus]PPH63477.1 ribonuclease III [Rathayibacter toxicus]PPH67819.1 ribonuclease III [Rathayibacter toxicus]PPH72622.1 ribonuclease III [Rathayibacter toxicus]
MVKSTFASLSRDDLLRLEATLGVGLDGHLLELALTHRSFAFEHGGIPHNERLEFLGDSILGQAVTVMLYTEYPELSEGELAKRRASLVSTVALAEIARSIGLGDYLRLGRGEELTGGRDKASILADTMEAVIGAVHLGTGPDDARDLVLRLIAPLRDDPRRFGASMDPKTSLQEAAAERGAPHPRYEVLATGPDHNKVFTATVIVGGFVTTRGEGSSKKAAEMAAALEAWTRLVGLGGVCAENGASGAAYSSELPSGADE